MHHVCGLGVLQDLLLCGEVSEFYQGRAGAGQQPAQYHPLDEPAGKPAELRAVHPLQPGCDPDTGRRDALLPHCFGGGADPGCRGGAERQCHAGARNHQHQRHRDGAQHLSFQKAAGFPYRISRHPAAHLEPLHPAGGAGREERRGGFCHCEHPGGDRVGAENGGAEAVLRGAGGRQDFHRAGKSEPDPEGVVQLSPHLPQRRERDPQLIPAVLPGSRRGPQAGYGSRHHRPDAHAGQKRAGACLCAGTYGEG